MLLLDVGPRMHPHVAFGARALADLLTSKVPRGTGGRRLVALLFLKPARCRDRGAGNEHGKQARRAACTFAPAP